MTEAPLLQISKLGKTFSVITDACCEGIGGILMQESEKGELLPTAYESRKTSKAESNYAVHELELLAIHHCLKSWRHFLEGTKFIIRTDHKSLIYIMKQKQLSRKQARWIEFMQGFDFQVEYVEKEMNE